MTKNEIMYDLVKTIISSDGDMSTDRAVDKAEILFDKLSKKGYLPPLDDVRNDVSKSQGSSAQSLAKKRLVFDDRISAEKYLEGLGYTRLSRLSDQWALGVDMVTIKPNYKISSTIKYVLE